MKSVWVSAFAIALGSITLALLTPATPARAEALLLIDANSGKVLRAENATYPWHPASLSKLMTLYLTLDAVRNHRITFDTMFTVSPNASAQAPTKMGFPVGTQVTVDNAIKMLMVKSANDMAVLLAEGISGSIDNFAEEMTNTAHRLGMSETNYVNPNGLPADGQITSARDLGILARALLHEFPEYSFYWHVPAIKFGKRITRNYNPLLGRYPGADGMKTGFICASGFNLVATAERGNRRLIAVVLGAPSGAARATKAAELLESGFAQNPLSWLTPSLGTVDNLAPIDAAPPDLTDEMCGKHRKRKPAEDEDIDANDAGTVNAAGDFSSQYSFMLSALRAPSPKNLNLLGDLGPVTPVVVYTGPTRTQAEVADTTRDADTKPVRTTAMRAKPKAPSQPAIANAKPENPAGAAAVKPRASATAATTKSEGNASGSKASGSKPSGAPPGLKTASHTPTPPAQPHPKSKTAVKPKPAAAAPTP